MGFFDFLFNKKNDKSPTITVTVDNNPGATEMLRKVEIIPGLELPKVFADHWKEIEKTKLPYISIKATATEDVSLHQSSFGYYPCIPKEFDYPKGENGNYLYPLAQINFSEFPNTQG